MRTIPVLLTSILVLGWVASVWPVESFEPPPARGWRLSRDGWQRQESWSPVTAGTVPTLHPVVVLGFELFASLLALAAVTPGGLRRRSSPAVALALAGSAGRGPHHRFDPAQFDATLHSIGAGRQQMV